jgi:hypothetical protein
MFTKFVVGAVVAVPFIAACGGSPNGEDGQGTEQGVTADPHRVPSTLKIEDDPHGNVATGGDAPAAASTGSVLIDHAHGTVETGEAPAPPTRAMNDDPHGFLDSTGP